MHQRKRRRGDASRYTQNWIDEVDVDWKPIARGRQRLANLDSKRIILYGRPVSATLVDIAIGSGVSPVSIEKIAAELFRLAEAKSR